VPVVDKVLAQHRHLSFPRKLWDVRLRVRRGKNELVRRRYRDLKTRFAFGRHRFV